MQTAEFAAKYLSRSLIVLLGCVLLLPFARGADFEQQRQLFSSVYAVVESGDWGAVDALTSDEQQLLRAYVLWPDLRATWYRANISKADPAEIDAFLNQYGVLKPARELRYRYALHLAKTGDLSGYLKIYQQFYQGLEIAKLDCLALRAEIAGGRGARVVNRAVDLWTVGESQVEECDAVFEHLTAENHLGTTHYMKRFELAIEAREFSMAQWLSKSIDQRHIDIAAQWTKAQRNPEAFVRDDKKWINDTATREQLVYAIERVTYDDPELALELWQGISKGGRFSAVQELRTARHIALWMARDNLPGAYKQLRDLPVAAQNDEVLRWRARTSLRDRNWSNLLTDIGLMSDKERAAEEWQYWLGIALRRSDNESEAEAVFLKLATERSYYGFLAADELGQPYAFGNDRFIADEQLIQQLVERPELIRARELFLVGQDGRGRSEWDAVIRYLSAGEKMQAAILAHRWDWHSRAIAAAASVGEYDDLSLRYPLPYDDTFLRYAQDASISATWAYGVARSESLFMRDVRSSAGAIGLMQLMPATGRDVAKDIQLPYSGLNTLTDPDSNIRLGTTYLAHGRTLWRQPGAGYRGVQRRPAPCRCMAARERNDRRTYLDREYSF